jgi:basic membrane lipoprotein Med (substrate-binding protein (PBP1-ABC) superfamily)
MVGGFPIPEVNRLMNAFMAGAREMNPDIRFQVAFIGSWFDPPKAKETAFAMIEAGADIMYAERFGVSDAAQERGILAIGNVIDTQPDYPDTVVASALWHFEPTLDAAIARVKAGASPPPTTASIPSCRTAAARSPRSAPSRARSPRRRWRWCRARGGDPRRQRSRSRSTTTSPRRPE